MIIPPFLCVTPVITWAGAGADSPSVTSFWHTVYIFHQRSVILCYLVPQLFFSLCVYTTALFYLESIPPDLCWKWWEGKLLLIYLLSTDREQSYIRHESEFPQVRFTLSREQMLREWVCLRERQWNMTEGVRQTERVKEKEGLKTWTKERKH